ncbi:MAG: hypothetical protein P8X90_21345, partial [Desulfobacterales bacterium]
MGYLDLLRKKLSKVEGISTSGQKYNCLHCGTAHVRGNPGWNPWRHIEEYCDKTCYDFLEARHMIFE